ncbi:MAG: BrnT family toxin [Synergistaceae bacterium]|nr:BrnT family toxin [Synergistaceae bacterium]
MTKHTEHDVIKLRIGDMLFTWDDEKERINIRKHGIDFSAAARVFLDEDVLLEYNSIDEYTGEERWNAIGIFDAGILFVVYVERVTAGEDEDDIIRIISARYAERKEKKRYVDGY